MCISSVHKNLINRRIYFFLEDIIMENKSTHPPFLALSDPGIETDVSCQLNTFFLLHIFGLVSALVCFLASSTCCSFVVETNRVCSVSDLVFFDQDIASNKLRETKPKSL